MIATTIPVVIGLLRHLQRAAWFFLIPMDAPSPTATREPDVYPTQGHGFALGILPALFGLVVIALLAMWLSSKPKRRR